jgi:stress response protein SCP2
MNDSAQTIIKSLLKFNLEDYSAFPLSSGLNQSDSGNSNFFSESGSDDSAVSLLLPGELNGDDFVPTVRTGLQRCSSSRLFLHRGKPSNLVVLGVLFSKKSLTLQ